MRDPNRLDTFYKELCELHKKYVPDWRFGQLIVNMTEFIGDPFYLEEDEMIEKIQSYFDSLRNKTIK